MRRLASWVGRRAGLELGRQAGFMVDGLVQISDGGKETNSKERWRRKCEERDIKFEQKYLFIPDFNRGGLRKTNGTYLR